MSATYYNKAEHEQSPRMDPEEHQLHQTVQFQVIIEDSPARESSFPTTQIYTEWSPLITQCVAPTNGSTEFYPWILHEGSPFYLETSTLLHFLQLHQPSQTYHSSILEGPINQYQYQAEMASAEDDVAATTLRARVETPTMIDWSVKDIHKEFVLFKTKTWLETKGVPDHKQHVFILHY